MAICPVKSALRMETDQFAFGAWVAVAIGEYRYLRSAECFEDVLLGPLSSQVRKRIIDPAHESH
jgi:hypothetical protein